MAVGLRRWLEKAGVARPELRTTTRTTKKLSWHHDATGLRGWPCAATPFMPLARSDYTRDRAIALYQRGEPIQDIAIELSIHTTTIYTWLRKAGINTSRRPGLNVPPEVVAEVLDAIDNGTPTGEVARAAGLTRRVVDGIVTRSKRNGQPD
jgi:hypothetical protein